MTQESEKLISAVINTLDGISVPSAFAESVVIPVYNCSRVLRQILEKETKNRQDAETVEPPKEEIVNGAADSAE